MSAVPDDASADENAFSEEDLRLGRKAAKTMEHSALAALVIVVGIAAFTMVSVPWDTKLPYSGKYGRNGLAMQVALFGPALLLFGLWRAGRKSDAHRMRRGSRGVSYVVGSLLIAGCLWGEWVLSQTILDVGGALN